MGKQLIYVAIWGLIIASLLNLSCRKPPPHEEPGNGITQLSFDRNSGNLTLKAKDASLLLILQQLNEKHQIEVTVPDLTTDRLVTVNVVNVPLRDALMKFLPSESRFHFIVKDLDLTIPGSVGTKKTKAEGEPKPQDLPTKDKTRPLPDDQRTKVKLPPEKVEPGKPTTGEQGTKFPPSDREIPPGQGFKRLRERVPEDTSHARLRLRIDQSGVRIERFLNVEGRLIQAATVDGEFVHAAFIDNKIVAVGSMQDPLGIRSYREDIGHSESRGEEASFVISLPSEFLNQETLRRTVIKFYLLEPTGDIPQLLTPQTFPRFEKFLKQVGEIGGSALLEASSKRNQ